MIRLLRNLVLLIVAIGAFQLWMYHSDSDIAASRPAELSQVEQVRVAMLWPFTKNGEPPDYARQGAQLAVEQINAGGGLAGKALVIDFFDNRGDAARNAELSRRISDDPTFNALVGSYYSSLALDTLVATHSKNLFYVIIGAELPSLTGYSFQHAIRPHFDTRDYTAALADLLFCQGHRRLAIIGDQSDFSAEIASDLIKTFTDHGGYAPSERTVPSWIKDFRYVLAESEIAEADAIFFSGSLIQLPHLLRQIKEFGLPAKIFVDSGALLNDTPAFVGPAGEGLQVLTTFNPAGSSKSRDFVRAFTARFGVAPDLWARESYDGMMLLAESIRATGSLEASTLFSHVRFLQGWDMVKGKVTFAPNGSLKGEEFYRVEIKNGLFTFPDGTQAIQACPSHP